MTWLVVTSHIKHQQRYISLIFKLLFHSFLLETVFYALITLFFKTSGHSCFLLRNYLRVLDSLYTFIGEKFWCKLFILMVSCTTLKHQECESKRILVWANSAKCTLYYICISYLTLNYVFLSTLKDRATNYITYERIVSYSLFWS